MVWNMFEVNNKDKGTTLMKSFWYLYCKFWTDFTHSSSVYIVGFEQVTVCKVIGIKLINSLNTNDGIKKKPLNWFADWFLDDGNFSL